ncbi:acyl transferase domain-containing protein [Coemansia spiralis]|nr:acyl transferase domain-containing protein [Coemansia spiralis]
MAVITVPPDSLAVFAGPLGSGSGSDCLVLLQTLNGSGYYFAQMSVFLKAEAEMFVHAFPLGFDLAHWLKHPDGIPRWYLDSAPVATVLVGLVQLARFWDLGCQLGIPLSDIASGFKAIAGHSLGLIVAVAVASGCRSADEFFDASRVALGTLLIIASHAPSNTPNIDLEATPMASVSGVPRSMVDTVLQKYNKYQSTGDRHIHISCETTKDLHFTCSGHPESLFQFILNVRKKTATDSESSVPFYRRKPQVTIHHHNMVLPFHCQLLEHLATRHMDLARTKNWLFKGSFAVPVCAFSKNKNVFTNKINDLDSLELTELIVKCIYQWPVDWPRTIGSATSIVDFSTSSSVVSFTELTCLEIDGRGIPLYRYPGDQELADRFSFVQPLNSTTKHIKSWKALYGPQLVKVQDKVHIDTKIYEILGLPPVIVSGIATMDVEFVAAVFAAGYHAELSVADTQSSDEMAARITELAQIMTPGYGISISCDFSTPQKWNQQLDTIINLRKDAKIPIIGTCIADSVPDDISRVTTAIQLLASAGIRYIALKPTTISEIQKVLAIAQQSPDFFIMLQWTGGRCGGQHSFEEFHQPLLSTYADIRKNKNVLLVGNSGFGDAQGVLPYLTGDWGELFHKAQMPLDGIMLCSRAMVSRESPLATEIKELIVGASGTDPYDALALFNGPNGGVVSILDHQGKSYHVISNRAAIFCHKLRDIWSQPREKHLGLLKQNRKWIIEMLNNDYARPWFACRGDDVVELHQMTYMEVINRLLDLTYTDKWIHPSYRTLVAQFVQRSMMRLSNTEQEFVPHTGEPDDVVLAEIARVRQSLPSLNTQLLATADIQFFLHLCQQFFAQRAVPFVPILDEHFGDYLFCDTTWVLNDLGSVVCAEGLDDAAQRVLIPQGPVAASYSTTANQSTAEILDGIYNGLTDAMQADFCMNVTEIEYIGPDPTHAEANSAVVHFSKENCYELPLTIAKDQLPDPNVWFHTLAGFKKSWLLALLTTPVIAQGTQFVDNYIARMLYPHAGQTVAIDIDSSNMPLGLKVWNSTSPNTLELELSIKDNCNITLSLFHRLPNTTCALEFTFRYMPHMPGALIHEIMDNRDNRVEQFFQDIWVNIHSTKPQIIECTEESLVFQHNVVIEKEHALDYCRSIGASVPNGKVPVDYLSVLALPSVFSILTHPRISKGLLQMVQTTYSVELHKGALLPPVGSSLCCVASVKELCATNMGKRVTLQSTMSYSDTTQPITTIHAAFLFLSTPCSSGYRHSEEHLTVSLPAKSDVAVLESKPWFIYLDNCAVEPNDILEFHLSSLYKLDSRGSIANAKTIGKVIRRSVYHEHQHIADIDFEDVQMLNNPMIAYLKQHEVAQNGARLFDVGYNMVKPHSSNDEMIAIVPESVAQVYAGISGDHNPHNTNLYFSKLSGLDKPIAHGLWTCASIQQFVSRCAANNDPSRVLKSDLSLLRMVHEGDKLETQIQHIGMRNNHILVDIKTYNTGTNDLVLEGLAEVAQPRTAYVFTGQGSQEVNMGMELYNSSPTVRAVYDRADQHTRERFGFSLVDIIRNNPREYTVHFGGKSGKQIRQNYMEFTINSNGTEVPLFSKITPSARSYTFQAPNGLLHATQFAQPAIMLLDVAIAEEMRSQGVFDEDPIIAGHSLGEYGALAAFGIMSLEDIIDITFIRGMTMQSTVERDEHGHSDFALVAANPSRVDKRFDEQCLSNVIKIILDASDGLLEIVNYNVRGFQYVVAGTRRQLELLGRVLDEIHRRQCSTASASGKKQVVSIVQGILKSGVTGKELKRGRATIPIPGIDVPFHSSHLITGASQFRSCIHKMIRKTHVDPATLINRYIPNLTATTLQVTKGYFEMMYNQTKSPVIQEELANWNSEKTDNDRVEVSRLARVLLIELLSYQFASPVRWIETQERFFRDFGIGKLIEIGTGATLSRMAEGSLIIMGMEKQVDVLHVLGNKDEVFFTPSMVGSLALDTAEDVQDINEDNTKTDNDQTADMQPAALSSVSTDDMLKEPNTIQPDTTQSNTSIAEHKVPDIPLTSLDIVRTVIAQKLNVSLSAVSGTKSVRELTGGKSTLQNEILGDLIKEFGGSTSGRSNITIPDRPDEISIQELSRSLGTSSGLGRHTMMQVARLFSTKMPGGFSQSTVRQVLNTDYGIVKPYMQDGVLLTALTLEPSARLAGVAEAQKWLASVIQAYAQNVGIPSLPNLSEIRAASSNSAGSKVAISYNDPHVAKAQQKLFVQQLEAYAQYLGMDLRKGDRLYYGAQKIISDMEKQIGSLHEELGTEFVAGVQPRFDKHKARHFDSYWNWACEDALVWIYEALSEQPVDDSHRMLRLRNKANPLLTSFANALSNTLSTAEASGAAYNLACSIRDQCEKAIGCNPVYIEWSQPSHPTTSVSSGGRITCTNAPQAGESTFVHYVQAISKHNVEDGTMPLIHLREKQKSHSWEYSLEQSSVYYGCLKELCAGGVSFAGRTALITGASSGSIAFGLLQRLLTGGARIVVTTSSYSRATILLYEQTYKKYGARGSELIVVPFNQGSASDIKSLVSFIYGHQDHKGSLGWHLDYIIPFAAVSEYGSDISSLGSATELSVRVMMTNVLRLLGEIRDANRQLGHGSQPTLAVLPLSPNHGVFGNDGLYGESKAALETVLNRWTSENWGSHMSVAAAVIGWTRGTGLMSVNDSIAPYIEAHNTRTFSVAEMAFNIMGLLHPSIVDIAQEGPVWADLNGGLQRIWDINKVVTDSRNMASGTSNIRSTVTMGYISDVAVAAGHNAGLLHSDFKVEPLFNHQQFFAQPRLYEDLSALHHLQGMVNWDKVVVITGYGEIGPFGHAESRWEMEAFGEFSLEGCIELAWIMGLIKHHDGVLPEPHEQKYYNGWVDAKTYEPVEDLNVKKQYEKHILAHTGLRLLEPELLEGQDPQVVPIMRELQIDHDLEPFEATADEAAMFKLRNNEQADIWENKDGSWSVKLLKGCVLMAPKALRFDRLVGGQLPTGWDPRRYGIPEDIVRQVDLVTCYAIVATMEALVRSGITDPYELYKYFHVSQIGSSLGSGAGGVHSIRDLYRNRLTDKPVQSDILQETFANTTLAWINMLLLSSAGAIRPPTGGCGTAVLSIDVAADAIRCGKARVMVAGGFEGFVDQGSYEFAQMGATGSSVEEMAMGRTPAEMSRPCTSTRSGFVEAQGAGLVVLMSGSAAIEFGAPIYGIIAHSATATDKQGASLPAPGKGLLTSAAQVNHDDVLCKALQILDIDYRRNQIDKAKKAIELWTADEQHLTATNTETDQGGSTAKSITSTRLRHIELKADRMLKEAQDTWGTEFWHNIPEISPLQGSLGVWGLTADDIGLASFHGTATIFNDTNEAIVLNSQLKHIGRAPGYMVPAVCQKWLTGHPKGPAAAWMLNSAIQSMRTGLIPGNRNADNIDKELKHEFIVFPSQTLKTPKVKACLLKSFGFGQVGAEMLVVHPDYFFATLDRSQLEQYNQKLVEREAKSYRYWQDTFAGVCPFVQVKSAPPYTQEQEEQVYLNPLARAQYDATTSQYKF